MSRRRLRVQKIFLAAAAAGLLGTAVAGAVEPTPKEHRLLVESITVTGLTRVKPDLLLVETRLKPGHPYSESELRAALFRVRRLPFILDAEMSLRRGSAPGSHELILEVEEVARFFFSAGLFYSVAESRQATVAPRSRDPVQGGERGFRPLAGVRLFPGPRSVVYGGLHGFALTFSDQEGSSAAVDVVVGLTRYDLFGRGGSLSLSWNERQCCDPARVFSLDLDPTGSRWSLGSVRHLEHELIHPLVGDHSLRFALVALETVRGSGTLGRPRQRGSFQLRGSPGEELRQLAHRRIELGWRWDTADDPQLPTRGHSLASGVVASDLEARFGGLLTDPPGERIGDLPSWSTESLGLVASGSHHWPLTPRQTLTVEWRGGVGWARLVGLRLLGAEEPFEGRTETWRGGGGVRWSLSLRPPEATRTRGDLRLEAWARHGVEGVHWAGPGHLGELWELETGVSVVLRNRWGLFVFGLSFHDLSGGTS